MTEPRAPYVTAHPPQYVSIVLPWPDRRLSPNSRSHWRAKQAPKTEERDTAYFEAMQAKHAELCGRLELRLICHPPDKRRRDLDNILAAHKAGIDGLCKAIGVDDSQIDRITIERASVAKPGKIVVIIQEIGG